VKARPCSFVEVMAVPVRWAFTLLEDAQIKQVRLGQVLSGAHKPCISSNSNGTLCWHVSWYNRLKDSG
jgi:hypothetical protein